MFSQSVYIGRTVYESKDSLFNLASPKVFEGMFYEIHHIIGSHIPTDEEAQSLFEAKLFLTPRERRVYRQAYDINNLLGDLGGVVRVLMTVFGVIFYPISRYFFYLNSAKKLYLARTKDSHLFHAQDMHHCHCNLEQKMIRYTDDSKVPCKYTRQIQKELKKHRVINLSYRDQCLLFFYTRLNKFACKSVCPW